MSRNRQNQLLLFPNDEQILKSLCDEFNGNKCCVYSKDTINNQGKYLLHTVNSKWVNVQLSDPKEQSKHPKILFLYASLYWIRSKDQSIAFDEQNLHKIINLFHELLLMFFDQFIEQIPLSSDAILSLGSSHRACITRGFSNSSGFLRDAVLQQ
ncbi:hypothetical protein ABPG72_020460 [Tetrahymena utriculariae]